MYRWIMIVLLVLDVLQAFYERFWGGGRPEAAYWLAMGIMTYLWLRDVPRDMK